MTRASVDVLPIPEMPSTIAATNQTTISTSHDAATSDWMVCMRLSIASRDRRRAGAAVYSSIGSERGAIVKRLRTASLACDVQTKKSGMNSTAMNVAASIPPITPVPIE